MELFHIIMLFFLALSQLGAANPCDGVDATPILYHEYTSADCPPPFPLNADGSCSNWGNYAYDCITYCQVNTTFDYATEVPFPRSECHWPVKCSLSEGTSTSWSWSFSMSPKVGKAVKLGASGSYSQSYGTSKGRSWSFDPEPNQCGYFTFVPVRKTVCGVLSQSIPLWEDGVWSCAPHVVNTDNYCAPGIWYDSSGDPDGVIIFVYTDCLTRQPLGPEFQDPVYNMPGVQLDRGTLATVMQSWVEDSCSSEISSNADGTETASFEINGKGFSDDQLGGNGEKLQGALMTCGTLASWVFTWTPVNGTYDWNATGDVTGNATVNGCIGDAVVAAGGSTKDQCN